MANSTGPRADPFDLFNRKLTDFVADLHPVIGHMSEYAFVSSCVKWCIQFDPRKNQEFFDRYVMAPYEDRIMRRDEQFFLNDSLGGYSEDMNVGGVVQLIKQVWATNMSDADRSAVWAHLHVLAVLNRHCRDARARARARAL